MSGFAHAPNTIYKNMATNQDDIYVYLWYHLQSRTRILDAQEVFRNLPGAHGEQLLGLEGWKTGGPKRVVGSWNLKVHRGISNYLVDFTSLFHYMFGKCGRPAQAAQIHEPVTMGRPI